MFLSIFDRNNYFKKPLSQETLQRTYKNTCTFYVVKVLVTRSRLRQDTTHVVMLGRKKVPNLILLSAKM